MSVLSIINNQKEKIKKGYCATMNTFIEITAMTHFAQLWLTTCPPRAAVAGGEDSTVE